MMGKSNPKHIHFMGIGGSGISGVAQYAKRLGYEVSGCDTEGKTAYLGNVRKEGISVYKGHSESHLKGVDLVVVSPSVFYQEKLSQEARAAKKKGILITWQRFVGEYLLKEKEVICISGTHGKSTTAAMAALTFEQGAFAPSAIIGAEVIQWKSNFRFGKGKVFIVEADEFYDNFLNYRPDAIIINNIEFDHPDYFDSYGKLIESFQKFVNRLKGRKILIVNQDSQGVKDLIDSLDKNIYKKAQVVGYTMKNKPKLKLKKSLKVDILAEQKNSFVFSVKSRSLNFKGKYELNMPGRHNVANCLGVIALSKLWGVEDKSLKKALTSFSGIGRRLELIGEKNGVRVYDDYAHHPTAIAETLSAVRQMYPKGKIWAVIEPHSFSRTNALLKNYKNVFNRADRVVVSPIFKARDRETFGVSAISIVDVANHKNKIYLDSFTKIADYLGSEAKKGDVVLVMGAGKSYQLARLIFERI